MWSALAPVSFSKRMQSSETRETPAAHVRRMVGRTPPLAAFPRSALVIGVAVLVLWQLGPVVLLVFAGGLVAILLAVPSGWLSECIKLRYAWCLGGVLFAVAIAAAGAGYALVPRVAEQVQQVETALPQDFDHVVEDVRNSSIGHLNSGSFRL
jgi:predicted PurR-regulated permease PerM